MKVKEFFSLKKNKFFWGNLAAMIVVAMVLIAIVFVWLGAYTRHGQAIVVPDAKGLTEQQAQKLFRSKDLLCVKYDSTYVKDKKAGIILEHNPPAGQKVKKGRVILLTTNYLSIPLQLVPDVADKGTLRQAVAKIEAAGFKLGKHETITGEKDWVYGIKYNNERLNPGDKVPMGATLNLVIGDGLAKEMFGSDSIPFIEDVVIENTQIQDDSWF